MHLSDDKSSRQFIIRYSEVESSPSKKKNRYSEKKQYIDIFQAQTQLNLPPKRIKSHRKNYQPLQTEANPTPRMKLLQSPKIQRNNSSSVDVYNHHQHKSQTKQKIKKQQREYSKIPIQYYDERDYGNIADKVRGRVIYRGYAPKNTYYYLKTIKDLHFAQDTIRNLRGQDIAFNSKFQSGNLNTAVKVSQKQYWLFMRQDTNTHGLRQWYYFEVKVRKAIRLKFRLYKFSKSFSLYKDGMRPYIKTLLTQWRQQGENVKYEFDNQIKCYYLEFQYQFQENIETYFATLPPYTYSTLMDYMKLLKEEDNIKVQNIGYSLSGLDIPSIVIKNSTLLKNQDHYHKKQVIFIMARTHPGQTNSNFALEGFIQKLLLDAYLLQKYDYYIIPMVNPDGVFLGNHRTGVLGQDLNRNFNSEELQYFPQIEIIHRWIMQIKKSQKIAFMIDLHGHSAKKNIFAYGEEHQFGSTKYLYSRILPKILSNTIDTFKYDHCVFRACKQKKNTARVYFSKKYKINSITFQQSYGLIEAGPIGIHNWKNFGIALAQSLKTFCQITEKDSVRNMQEILKEQMKLQKIQIQKRSQKHRKMMSMHQKLGAQTKLQKRKTQNLEGLSTQLQKSFEMYISEVKFKQEKSEKLEVLEEEQQIKSDDKNSVNSQQLSSGDQDMELTNNQLDNIKKDIVRVKGQKQIVKREIYNLADKKVQLKTAWGHHQQLRLHNDRSSMIPRILKLQMKKKQQYLAHNYIGGASFQFKQKRGSVQLPYLKK